MATMRAYSLWITIATAARSVFSPSSLSQVAAWTTGTSFCSKHCTLGLETGHALCQREAGRLRTSPPLLGSASERSGNVHSPRGRRRLRRAMGEALSAGLVKGVSR
jgi:hypothetical protein